MRFRIDGEGDLTLDQLLDRAPQDSDDELLGDLLTDEQRAAVRGMLPGDEALFDLGASGVWRVECVDALLWPSRSHLTLREHRARCEAAEEGWRCGCRRGHLGPHRFGSGPRTKTWEAIRAAGAGFILTGDRRDERAV